MELLKIKNLTFGYEDSPVLKNFNMAVCENEILLIEGQNGVGKTTLLKCLTNVINNGKSIYIDDEEILSNKDKLKQISFIMSEDTLYDYLTCKENINFFKALFDADENYVSRVNELCETFDIEKYHDYLIKNLSQGTRNKLYLAIMLSKEHTILILDEPFTALDKRTQEIVINMIKCDAKEGNKCVIMVTHVEEFKNLATRRIEICKIENAG